MNPRFRLVLRWVLIALGAVLIVLGLLAMLGWGAYWYRQRERSQAYDNKRQPILVQGLIERDGAKVIEALSDPRSINTPSTNGTPPLALAVTKGSAQLVGEMIRRGADPNAQLSMGGWTPLHLAVEQGDLAKIEVLVKGGASINKPNDYGQTALIVAVQRLDKESVVRLASLGANVNEQGSWGISPLFTAANECDVELVRVLLDHGADPTQANRYGVTPLARAREIAGASAQETPDPTWPQRARTIVQLMEARLGTAKGGRK